MLNWLTQLDRLLRGDVTRPTNFAKADSSRCRRHGRDDRGAGHDLWPVHGFVFVAEGSADVAPRSVAAYMQLVATTVKVPALFYLTLIVTFPSLYVFNALVGSRLTITSVLAAAGGVAGREPGRVGIARADRDVLLGEHEELRVHSIAERRGVQRRRRAGLDVFAADIESTHDLATSVRRLPDSNQPIDGAAILRARRSTTSRSTMSNLAPSTCRRAKPWAGTRGWCSAAGWSCSRWSGTNGLGAAAVHRQPDAAVRVVPAAAIEFLRSRAERDSGAPHRQRMMPCTPGSPRPTTFSGARRGSCTTPIRAARCCDWLRASCCRPVLRRGDGQLSRVGQPAAVAAANRVLGRQSAAAAGGDVRHQLAEFLRAELAAWTAQGFCSSRSARWWRHRPAWRSSWPRSRR